jgi:hypothetical protein
LPDAQRIRVLNAVPGRELLLIDAMLPRDFRQRLAALHDMHGRTRLTPAHGQRGRARAGSEHRKAHARQEHPNHRRGAAAAA